MPMPNQPIVPDLAVRASVFETWQDLPGGFTKIDRLPRAFSLAALTDRSDVEIVRLHLDLLDRPTVVAVITGSEPAGLLVDVRPEAVHIMAKGTSIGALATALEVAASCLSLEGETTSPASAGNVTAV